MIVEPDVQRHAAQIADAVRRLEAPPRPLARGEELVVIRRRPKKSAAEATKELGLTDIG